jgi:hypothetical protein
VAKDVRLGTCNQYLPEQYGFLSQKGSWGVFLSLTLLQKVVLISWMVSFIARSTKVLVKPSSLLAVSLFHTPRKTVEVVIRRTGFLTTIQYVVRRHRQCVNINCCSSYSAIIRLQCCGSPTQSNLFSFQIIH